MTYIIKYIKYFKSFLKESNIEGRIGKREEKGKKCWTKKGKVLFWFSKQFNLKGLTEVNVVSVEEINFLFDAGNRNLTKVDNGINSSSSRCHSIFEFKFINERGELSKLKYFKLLN